MKNIKFDEQDKNIKEVGNKKNNRHKIKQVNKHVDTADIEELDDWYDEFGKFEKM